MRVLFLSFLTVSSTRCNRRKRRCLFEILNNKKKNLGETRQPKFSKGDLSTYESCVILPNPFPEYLWTYRLTDVLHHLVKEDCRCKVNRNNMTQNSPIFRRTTLRNLLTHRKDLSLHQHVKKFPRVHPVKGQISRKTIVTFLT